MNNPLDLMLNQAVQAMQNGNFSGAETILKRVIQAHPTNLAALNILGLATASQSKHREAVEIFKKAVRINNKDPGLHYNLAKAFLESGQDTDAIQHHKKTTEFAPKNPNAWLNYGKSLSNLGRHQEAIEKYDRALSIESGFAEVLLNKGASLKELKKYQEALECAEKALSINSSLAEAWSNRGVALKELRRYQEAIESFEKAISIKPDFYEAWSNRGLLLKELRRYQEAIESFEKAISIKPNFYEAWSNRGSALTEIKHYDRALESYNQAIDIKPDFYNAHCNKAFIQLLIGNFENGWENYEYRWGISKAEPYRHPNLPRLKEVQNLTDKKILVWGEQGHGDTIQFVRYIAALQDKGAKVTLEIQPSLKKLLADSIVKCEVICPGESSQKYDYEIPLMSLGLLFKTNLSSIPNKTPYLRASEAKLEFWSNNLKLKEDKLNIGIACSGFIGEKHFDNRLIDLEKFQPYSDRTNLFLIQKDLRAVDISYLESQKSIQYLGNGITNFEDTAAIIELMDAIVTIDTSIAHLAGALGKKTYLLLAWNPDWRWLQDRSDSPWYPSVNLIRQQSINNWDGCLESIFSSLNDSMPKPSI
ncbi:tetratricopeptide repeat protein [Polynucleobacter paneuropaeus]|jgi:tetratricopeptide (TPR) repeat protein|nr:tetratricopeptide repeat protein [Polynucleobacter paneuropaeus]MBT8610553.1 tetratricopeptide repeat protein [Polynucleobacter paneuropaeus]QWD27311.1 tetratricopeptide repeat protein [Polynucleobacter paneuropaeus]